MTPPVISFNLVRQPWVPVETSSGRLEDWSLERLFLQAHLAKGLGAVSPAEYVVLMRFLLAIAHRGLMGPTTGREWIELWKERDSGFPDDRISQYLEKWEHRFDLFDPEVPFGQNLKFPRDRVISAKQLVLEMATGYDTLFEHSHPNVPTKLTPAQATRGLLSAMGFGVGTGGGPNRGAFKEGIVFDCYSVFCEGATLFESLVLNLLRYDKKHPSGLSADTDTPFWELEDQEFDCYQKQVVAGLTDLYTWRGRKILLLPEPDGSVSRIRYEPGLEPLVGNFPIPDPFLRFDEAKDGLKARKFSKGRSFWRDSEAILETGKSANASSRPPLVIKELSGRVFSNPDQLADLSKSIVAVGVVKNPRNVANLVFWRMDRMALPFSFLVNSQRRETLYEAINYAESAWSGALRPASRDFANTLLKGLDGKNGKPLKANDEDVSSILSRLSMEQRYWSNLDPSFQKLLNSLGDGEPANVLDEWKQRLRDLTLHTYVSATASMEAERSYQARSVGQRSLYGNLKRIGLQRDQKKEG